jgi:hypothetical protein
VDFILTVEEGPPAKGASSEGPGVEGGALRLPEIAGRARQLRHKTEKIDSRHTTRTHIVNCNAPEHAVTSVQGVCN